ncbi:AAA family ATPase [Chryseobacterium sp. G0162]|uniref:ATP-binding protein n=1 Tax=Chryseobacterium sp. G0162 TaxID=2487063 RepID=UPI000F4EB7FE|nr:ATP-binding protein [Chryseobacterium sp. G0162]AZB09304.1 AAA family ATPase [Chryseobacterium sp. G0162]
MSGKIFFIGGIHGVGKSTICKSICKDLNLKYLSASQLLKWDESEDPKNKKVSNILQMQNKLIIGLKLNTDVNKNYLLDGHYCLLNKKNKVQPVPHDTFIQINPINLNIILGNVSEISTRLQNRDNIVYSIELLKKFQNYELSYAQELSKKLNIDLNIGTQDNYSEILEKIYKKLNTP